jgi:adenylate kinase
MKIVLLGAPGSGKGTHSGLIEKHYGIPHISTGEIFREAMKNNTELGKLARSYIDFGNLVPDDVTIDLVKERIKQPDCKNGFLLDGFPRTVEQGKKLNEFAKPDIVLYFNINLDVALYRLLNRRVCIKCGSIYNLLLYGKTNCEKCGGELSLRDDDNEEVIKKRFEVFKKQTLPLVNFYKKLDLLKEVDVNLGVEEVRKGIIKVFKEF